MQQGVTLVSRISLSAPFCLTCYAVTSIYMSNGKCGDNCRGSYVFAVIQDQNCWCSNYIPADQDSTSLCNSPCPGFPDDKCGNIAQGLYGYFNLGGTPSGTAGGSSSAAAASTSVASSTTRPSSTTSSPPSVSTIVPTRTGSSTSEQTPPSRPPTSSFSFSFAVSLLTSYVPSQSSAEPSSSSLSPSTVSQIVSTPSSATVRVNHSLAACATSTLPCPNPPAQCL